MNIPNKDQDPIGAYLFAARDSAGATTPETDDEDTETTLPEKDAAEDVEDALNEEAEPSDEQEDSEDDADETTPTGDTKRPGYDAMLEAIKEKYGEAGREAFKALQARTTRAEQRASEIEKLAQETREMLEELDKRTQKEGGEEESEEQLSEFEQILSTIKDPQQRELFKRSLEAWKKEQGIITKKDQETEREQQAIVQLATEATRRGVETFGEDFGTLDGSTFKPNPAYVEKARPVLQRLTEQGALTHEDLYWLAYGPDLVQKAREEGRAAALSESNGKKSEQVRRAKKASVVNRPSGGSSDSPLYNREDPKQVGDIRGFLKRAQAQLSKVGTKMSV